MAQSPSQLQYQYQYQSQPPLFPIQQWTRPFPSPSSKSTVWLENGATEAAEECIISTDPALISLSALDDAFAQEYMYWAKPLPADVMKDMIDRSLCFGVYRYKRNNTNVHVQVDADADANANANTNTNANLDGTTTASPGKLNPSSNVLSQIGFARLITDNITFAYLTDVYILPEYQGTGLGTWMLQCINEWVESRGENFRRLMFVTVGDRAERYYQRVMGAETQGRKGDVLIMGRKGKGSLV
ncbi:hypothetical protein AJ78_07632 [Emergomyces pasteurianus Ep9510]|uniref:N-acetyltransferase domain-containing protein n=1 Tax=Emergomyces pasteurianus Ep9510 TaxID=1447872 RepID=A0A1J9P696_9EURO|nr:hypothetical protein AJ78_07632 [Emergomyces pasteurianus Ep9510]